jgi:phosphatidylinositol glycan class M
MLSKLRMTRAKAIRLVVVWLVGQAAWLGTAYQLEIMGQSVHLMLWLAGISLFGASVWILGEIIESWDAREKTLV